MEKPQDGRTPENVPRALLDSDDDAMFEAMHEKNQQNFVKYLS